MNHVKRTTYTTMLLFGLFAVGCLVNALPVRHTFLLRAVSSFYYLFLAVVMTLYFIGRVADSRTRHYLTAVGVLVIFWIFVRAVKYSVFIEDEAVLCQLWYVYYIPMLSIPQLSFTATLSVGQPKDKKLSPVRYLTGGITVLLMLVVLTNDSHQWVFGFLPHFENALSEYTHKPMFWVVIGWSYAFLVFSILFLFFKCRLLHGRKLIWLPAVYGVILGAWLVATALDVRPKLWGSNVGEFPETASFLVGGLWLIYISTGLVPSNRGYGRLFSVTSLAV